uniref:(California timema) hypothetical protein n=1 Tax=Timema californicum TaxID=61474 RepID=A0A7R9JE72_TIMCA|nr:unnamed protein product [Timema californicum]
MDYELGRLN